MKNFVQPGHTMTVAAPYAVASGAGCLVGSLFGVASAAASSGADVEIVTEGVFDLVKAGSQAWTVGARIYWDDTANVCTTTAASNKLIGVAAAAVGSGAGETIGRVRLTAAFTL
jgi:predicted RecA/RadA family phage recombinase